MLFDLDGTLSDPAEGITLCVQHALRQMGMEEADRGRLLSFIGPPLAESFREHYGMDDDACLRAIEHYRRRFSRVGMYENVLYAGVAPMLHDLRETGALLGLATSKPTVFAREILRHFGILDFLHVVVGSNLDGTRLHKREIIQEALRRLPSPHGRVAMVGDRHLDVQGAQDVGVDAIGVTYGYGSQQEIAAAAPTHVCETVDALRALLLVPVTRATGE